MIDAADANEVFDVPLEGRLVTPGKNPWRKMESEEDFERRQEEAAEDRRLRFAEGARLVARRSQPVRASDMVPGYAEQYEDEIGETLYENDRLAGLRARLIQAKRR